MRSLEMRVDMLDEVGEMKRDRKGYIQILFFPRRKITDFKGKIIANIEHLTFLLNSQVKNL